MATAASSEILGRLQSLYPKSIDLTLYRPKRLLAALGHPERQLPPVIHFAGTNGKGSTLAMTRAGMEAAGLRVHAYISPHLTKFHERITLAGDLIGEDDLATVLRECEKVNEGEPISLFEITTCAAFLAFSRVPADALLLEVGLGGRLDATNVVENPMLTCISPVSMDHQQYLGETISQIASEKAGILKRGVPCIVSRQRPDALQTIRKAASASESPLFEQGHDWTADIAGSGLRYRDQGGELLLPRPNLVGAHQCDNAGAAIALLRNLGFNAHACEAAVSTARWPARMQRLVKGPLVDAAAGSELWLDGGHNEAAGAALALTLREMPARTTRIICGMIDTKDVRSFLKYLRSVADRLHAVAIPDEAASLPAASIAAAAADVGFNAHASSDPVDAVRTIAQESPGARILVCGSLYLAGRLLRENS